jgi:hypothetical protein
MQLNEVPRKLVQGKRNKYVFEPKFAKKNEQFVSLSDV